MEWHIVNSSKGGVGKTLLTLLLLAYYLKETINEGILVLDLNAMNTDLAAMLLHGNTFAEKITQIRLEPSEKCRNNCGVQSDRIIALQKCSSEYNDFVVGWTTNPFLLYEHDNFAGLLSRIRKYARNISEELTIKPLKHVIIDTNHHFCSLFPPQDEHYNGYHQEGGDDHFNIWFLWVYRQLKKLLEKRDTEITTIIQTAGAIERLFRREGEMGPIIHTYAPLGLLPTEAKKGGLFGWGKENLPDKNQDYSIPELEKLENLEKIGEYLKFNQWITKLQRAQQNVLYQIERGSLNIEIEDTHRIFSAMLNNAIRGVVQDDSLPINIFPLSLYQPALEGYTDRERPDIIAKLRELETYKRFKKLLDRKYSNSGNDIL